VRERVCVYERERLCVCMCDCACVFVTSLMMVDGTQNRGMKRFLVKSDTESRTMDCIFDTDCSESTRCGYSAFEGYMPAIEGHI